MLRAEQWRKADEFEREAYHAMMHRQAQNAKRVKASDLYRHPGRKTSPKVVNLREKTQADNEWLSRLKSASGHTASRKE